MPVEQVMERIEDDVARLPAGPVGVTSETAAEHRDNATPGTFSPDPQQRTDRYRLVTPYLLRL